MHRFDASFKLVETSLLDCFGLYTPHLSTDLVSGLHILRVSNRERGCGLSMVPHHPLQADLLRSILSTHTKWLHKAAEPMRTVRCGACLAVGHHDQMPEAD